MASVAAAFGQLQTHQLDLLLTLAAGADAEGRLPPEYAAQVCREEWGDWHDYELLLRQQLITRKLPFQPPQMITTLGMQIVELVRPR